MRKLHGDADVAVHTFNAMRRQIRTRKWAEDVRSILDTCVGLRCAAGVGSLFGGNLLGFESTLDVLKVEVRGVQRRACDCHAAEIVSENLRGCGKGR
jgi:hypothetical protein